MGPGTASSAPRRSLAGSSFMLSSCISSEACVLAAPLSCQFCLVAVGLHGRVASTAPETRSLSGPFSLAAVHHGAHHRLPELDPLGRRPSAPHPFIPGPRQRLYVDGPSVSSFPLFPEQHRGCARPQYDFRGRVSSNDAFSTWDVSTRKENLEFRYSSNSLLPDF